MNILAAINIVLELALVLRLWRSAQRAYEGFLTYLIVSTASSTVLLALLMMELQPQYRIAWFVTEILLAIPGVWMSWEAFRNLKKVGDQLPEAVTIILAMAVMASVVVWRFSHYSGASDPLLERVFALKATVEFFFAVMLAGMLAAGHIPKKFDHLEVRHGVLLCIYFLLNSFTFFGYGLASAQDRMRDFKVLDYILFVTCTGCLVAWLWIFSKGNRARLRS